jgi:Acetoacetate decarboxylase (ADC)
MKRFFDDTRPGKTVDIAGTSIELPVLYFRDDLFMLFFTAAHRKVKELMPSERLHPIALKRDRALVAIAAFNYIDTTIGSYGEIGVVAPVVYGKKAPPIVVPALLESGFPGFGMVILHLPVTNQLARDGGRGLWGYPKFVADMHFTITPEYMECRLSEKQDHILTIRAARRGMFRSDRKPIVTFSVKDNNLIKTAIPQKGSYRFSINPKGSGLELGNHAVSKSIGNLSLSRRPLMSRCYVERSAILPEGEVIEKGVRPLDGHEGDQLEGEHSVRYSDERKEEETAK